MTQLYKVKFVRENVGFMNGLMLDGQEDTVAAFSEYDACAEVGQKFCNGDYYIHIKEVVELEEV